MLRTGAPGGIRTPDHLIRSPLPVGAAPRVDSCVEDDRADAVLSDFRGESRSRPEESLNPIA